MLAIGRSTIACTASVWLTFTSMVVASISMGIPASWLAAVVITTLDLVHRQMVNSTIVKILILAEARELTNILHPGSFNPVSSRQECIAMSTAKRTVEPFFGFFVDWIWFHSSGKLLCILKTFLPMAVVVQARWYRLLGCYGFHKTEYDISRLRTIEIAP